MSVISSMLVMLGFATVANKKIELRIFTQDSLLSMTQDIIHILSNGKKAMPKNIGLAIAVKSLVRSKELNEVLHKNGRCVS